MRYGLSNAYIRRKHLRRGWIFTAIGVLFVVAIIVGWIKADWDPTALVSTRRGGMPVWIITIWIGVFATALLWFGISQLRTAALFHEEDKDEADPKLES